MKKIHRANINRQAALLNRVVKLIRRAKPEEADDQEGREKFADNNTRFCGLKFEIPALTKGQQARVARVLIRRQMKGTHSFYSLVGWSNTYDVKDQIKKELWAIGAASVGVRVLPLEDVSSVSVSYPDTAYFGTGATRKSVMDVVDAVLESAKEGRGEIPHPPLEKEDTFCLAAIHAKNDRLRALQAMSTKHFDPSANPRK